MSKFLELISDNSNATLKRRANSIAQNAQIAQQNIVNSLKQQKSALELKIADLTDFAPDTTDSLRPGNKDWDAENWAQELQKANEQLWQVNISLEIAEKTYNEYFV